jgi:hypothetical protein
MPVNLLSAGGGTTTLTTASSASNFTLTLPATTGTMAIQGPAFSAYLSANQTISANTITKVALNVERFDTNSNYDPTTNYRFTPTVAGYYQLSMNLYSNDGARTGVFLYKNGALFAHGSDIAGTTVRAVSGSVLVYANGTTDYFEMYGLTSVTSFIGGVEGVQTYFTGAMVRSA